MGGLDCLKDERLIGLGQQDQTLFLEVARLGSSITIISRFETGQPSMTVIIDALHGPMELGGSLSIAPPTRVTCLAAFCFVFDLIVRESET